MKWFLAAVKTGVISGGMLVAILFAVTGGFCRAVETLFVGGFSPAVVFVIRLFRKDESSSKPGGSVRFTISLSP